MIYYFITTPNNFNEISILFKITELGHKIRDRPEKRVGGGGYGRFKNMNKDEQKVRKFRPVNSNGFNQKKKFTR